MICNTIIWIIKEHSVKAAIAMREGKENTLLADLAADDRLPLDRPTLDGLINDPIEFSGDAREQVARVVTRIGVVTSAHPAAAKYTPASIR